jgi:hypothetical protein
VRFLASTNLFRSSLLALLAFGESSGMIARPEGPHLFLSDVSIIVWTIRPGSYLQDLVGNRGRLLACPRRW